MTKVVYLDWGGDSDEVVDGLRRTGSDLTVERATPTVATDPPDADCVVTSTEATVDGEPVATVLRTAGYRGAVVLLGAGSHETLAARVDDLGATTYVRRDVAGDEAPWVRLAEAIRRVTTGERAGDTRQSPGAETARDLCAIEDGRAIAATVVEVVGRTLGVEAAFVSAPRSGDDAHVVEATDGFDAALLDDEAVTAAIRDRTDRFVGNTAGTDDGAAVAVVPVGDSKGFVVDGRGGGGVDPDVVRALAAVAGVALERAGREARLRADRDRVASLFENTSDAIVDVEFVDGAPVVRDVNSTFERVFGYTRERLLGENIDEFVVPEDADASAAAYRRHALAGEPYEQEVRRATAGGVRDFLLRSVPFDREGATRGYAIYTDITERKRIERTLGRLHDVTRDLIRAETPTTIAERTVDAATDILGYPVTVVRLYDPATATLRLAATSSGTERILGERPVDDPEVGLAREAFETGTPTVVDDLAAHGVTDVGIGGAMYLPLGDQGLLTLGSPAVDRFDEADRRLAEVLAANVEVALDRTAHLRTLREREEELARQNERLEAFASVVSHDLRNPLSVARGYLELARDVAAAGEDPTRHFERVERAHERMNRLITDLLALARQGQAVGTTESVRLDAVARRAWTGVDTGAATLEVVADREIQADGERLDTLFENLFRNAVEHGTSGDGGAVRVRVGPMDHGFYVADDGPGIPAEDRETVFERGHTTGESGTGFGLSIVRGIAEAHGWDIRVTAASDGGARFEVTGVDTAARTQVE